LSTQPRLILGLAAIRSFDILAGIVMDNIISKKIHKRQRDDDDDDEDENEVLIENDEAVENIEDAAAVKARIVAKAEKFFSYPKSASLIPTKL
jgi:hypothetical protein